jgi:hypothetical protein
MTSRLAGSLVLLVAATAAAEERTYTIADLERLVAQSAWTEAAHHLGDIPPSKRAGAWIAVATKTAVGWAISSEKDGSRSGFSRILELEHLYPELLASAGYVKARAPVMYELLEGCMEPHVVGACMELAENAVKAVPGDRAFALKVAKLARRNPVLFAEDALPLFALALGAKDNATICNDEDLKLAVFAGLGLPDGEGDARLTQATSIAFESCWTALMKPILDELDKPGVASDFRANTCKRLDARRQLTKRRPAACSRKG